MESTSYSVLSVCFEVSFPSTDPPMRRPLLPLAFLVLAAFPLTAQHYALAKCDVPREPLGYLRGGGEVRYLLRANGRPDTASVAVIRADGISAGGYRSAVVRQLSACRMARPTNGPTVVRQGVRFDSIQVAIEPAAPAERELPVLAIAEATPRVEVFAESDSLLEERPRLVRCERSAGLPIRSQERVFTSREEVEAAIARDARDYSGRLRARLVLDTTGRVMRDSIEVLESDNVNITNTLRANLGSCRYTPARIAGVPVAVRVIKSTGIRISSVLQ
jgi:hypothetical protein